MGFATDLALNYFSTLFSLTTVLGIFLQGLCSGVIGIVVGVAVLRILRSPELREVWQTLHAKIWKTPVVAEAIAEL